MFLENSWVNWVEAEECAYNIPAFFEWDEESDPLACLPRIPVVRVTKPFFSYVETGLNELPKVLLEETADIFGESLFALTDGVDTLVVATLGYDVPMLKSRLDITREMCVLRGASEMETRTFCYTPIEQIYTDVVLHPRTMVGLTRTERKQKKELLHMLSMVKDEPRDVWLYYYTELFPAAYEQIRGLSQIVIQQKLNEAVQDGWSAVHKQLHQLLQTRLNPNEYAFDSITEKEEVQK